MSKKDNLTNQVYQDLKYKIINNEILPNAYLDEKNMRGPESQPDTGSRSACQAGMGGAGYVSAAEGDYSLGFVASDYH